MQITLKSKIAQEMEDERIKREIEAKELEKKSVEEHKSKIKAMKFAAMKKQQQSMILPDLHQKKDSEDQVLDVPKMDLLPMKSKTQ